MTTANEPPGGGSKLALLSLVLGLASILCLAFAGVPAVILGLLAHGKADASGKTMAKIGIALGMLMTVVTVVVAAREEKLATTTPETDREPTSVLSRSTAGPPHAPPRAAAEPAEPAGPPHYAPGETFKLGDFSYRIDKGKKQRTVGRGYARRKAPKGAKFFLVSYGIRNDSNETATVMASDFKLEDAKGRTFRPSSDAQTALAMSGVDIDAIVSELQPGIAKGGICAFLVPADALSPGLFLVVPEKGLLSTGEARVKLR